MPPTETLDSPTTAASDVRLDGRPAAPPTVAEALLRRWWLIVACALVAAALAAVLAGRRAPEWTADSRLGVGRVALDAQSVPGYAEGARSLAAAYSRMATSEPVLEAAARKLRTTPAAVRGRTLGTQIADSPTLRIEARAVDARTAVDTANAVTESLTAYLKRINTTSTAPLLDRVRVAQRSLAAAQMAQRRAAARLQRTSREGAVRRARETALLDAQAVERTGGIRADAAAQKYRDALTKGDPDQLLQVLNPASQATSDLGSHRQKLILTGLVGGGLVGAMLALLLARRAWLRLRR